MRISQKTMYGKSDASVGEGESKEENSNLGILDKIKEFLDIKSVTERTRIREKYVDTSYEVKTSRISSSAILISYLSVYPLFSSKHQDYLD